MEDVVSMVRVAKDSAPTRASGLEAARFVFGEHQKQLALERLEAAQVALENEVLNPITLFDVAAELQQVADAGLQAGTGRAKAHPLDISYQQFTAERYISYPPRFEWLLQHSLLLNDLGLIIGPPGAGKSFFGLYLCVCLSAGVPVLGTWQTGQAPMASLYLSAEDSEAVLWRRVYHILRSLDLSEEQRAAVAKRLIIVPVSGDVRFFNRDKKTETPRYLRRLIEKSGARLMVLDNIARFFGGDENSNSEATLFCSEVESIIGECGINAILLHHTNKSSGDALNKKEDLYEALKQGALRGASAFAGATRWMCNLAPIGPDLALKMFGKDAAGKPPGSYVAFKVSKKNSGSPEPSHFFERQEHGLLHKVEPVENDKGPSVVADAHMLAAEVRRREAAGEPPLSVSKGGREAFEG